MLIDKHTFTVFQTVGRGLEAQRIAMGAATENIANANTSRTAEGGPYAMKRALHELPDQRYRRFSNMLNQMRNDLTESNGKHFQGTSLRRRLDEVEMGPQTHIQQELQSRFEYDPTHPHANAEGYVEYPDINVVEQMAQLISANRIYEANLSAFQTAKEMTKKTLEI